MFEKELFDITFIKKFCPPEFDSFEFIPSIGTSRGVITIWKSSVLEGQLSFQNNFAISVDFTSKHNNADWVLTNVYGPCTADGKREFAQWLRDIQMPDEVDSLLVGDFNLLRSPDDRNKPGGDVAEMFLFNEAIGAQGLVDFHYRVGNLLGLINNNLLLLERLDWFFTSTSRTISYPDTSVR